MVPGTLLMALVLFGLGRINSGTSSWAPLGLHLALSVGLALLFTPLFTSSFGPLPPELYSHGSAILSTPQQVAGVAGTALLVTLMAGRAATLGAQGVAPLQAQVSGLQLAFIVSAAIAVVAVLLSLFLKRSQSEHGQPDHGVPEHGHGETEHGQPLAQPGD